MSQPKLYADKRTKWRENKRHQRHPATRHVAAPQGPSVYVTSLEVLIATGQRFGCIYADPPWLYGDDPPSVDMRKHYSPMPLDAICALPVRDLALPQSHLHCWVTATHLFEVAQVFAAWDFTLKSHLVWGKTTKDGKTFCMGGGSYWRNSHEVCLIGVRGDLVGRQHNLRSVVLACRRAHSEKPDEARDLIEQFSPGPYLELFGRAAVPGWTVFGNQCLPANGRLLKMQVG
jgi:N6-adenosine-specific RNA methylase IME4